MKADLICEVIRDLWTKGTLQGLDGATTAVMFLIEEANLTRPEAVKLFCETVAEKS